MYIHLHQLQYSYSYQLVKCLLLQYFVQYSINIYIQDIYNHILNHISLSEKSKEKSLPSCLSGERSDTDIHIPSSLKCITRSAYKIQCVPSNTNNLQRSECRFEFSKALQLNEGKAKLYATTNRRIAYR